MLEIMDPGPFLEDAAHYPGGHAAGAVFPRSSAEAAEAVAAAATVLPVGAQSSLTGGATPQGELIVSTSRMQGIGSLGQGLVTVGAGVTVAAMQEHLTAAGAWFPPVPTYAGATAGGIVSTNAAGAATFKYGSTREWVQGLTVVLADGTILDLVRGRHRPDDGRFSIATNSGVVTVPVPRYAMPRVAKRSAGYHAEPGMDLVDLFIGAEGTLGIVTAACIKLFPRPAGMTTAMIALVFLYLLSAIFLVGAELNGAIEEAQKQRPKVKEALSMF